MRVIRLLSAIAIAAAAAACLNFDGLSAGAGAGAKADSADASSADASSADASSADADSDAGSIVLRGVAQAGPVPAKVAHELAVPPETQQGDFMILAAFNDRQRPESAFEDFDASLGAAVGWKEILRLASPCGTARGPAGLIVYVKVAGPDERIVYVRYNQNNDLTDMSSSLLSVWGGVDRQAPVDATMSAAPITVLEAPSVTTTGPDRVLLALFSNSAGAGASPTAPPGMTQRASTGFLTLFSELVPNAGETGPRTAQTSREVCGAAAIALALRPALR